MGKSNELSRRERQIMDILYANGEATVRQVQAELPGAPTDMAIRRLMQILKEKGWIRGRKEGRAVIYSPKKSVRRAGINALKHVVDTFFGGAVEEALAAHLSSRESLTAEQIEALESLLADARSAQPSNSKSRNAKGEK